MDGQYPAAPGQNALFHQYKNTKKHFSGVYGIQRDAGFLFETVDEGHQFPVHLGIAPKLKTGHQFPTIILRKGTDIPVQKIPFQGGKAQDPLPGPDGVDQSGQGGPGAHRTADPIEMGIPRPQDLFTAFDPQGIAPAFGQEQEIPKSLPQAFQKGGTGLLAVGLPGDKMEAHSLGMGQGQGGILPPTVLELLPPDDPNGLQAGLFSGTGQGRYMVGIGPTKTEQAVLALYPGLDQVVFELAVFVPRN